MPTPEVDVIVFDVLGTLVDEPSGLRAGLRAALPGVADHQLDDLLASWSAHIARAQEQIVAGHRPFRPGSALNREAAELAVREATGSDDPSRVDALAEAAWRLPSWPDAPEGLARLATTFPVIGLSNADRGGLLRLNAYAGLRFHQALSAELARTYKPAAAVYRLALDVAGLPADRLLMVAAHAWDLRGARELGMRTAYVPRPAGDPPTASDHVDLRADHLDDLADQLCVPTASETGATGGAFTVIRGTMGPGLAGPPPHIHDGHDETFVVISGCLRFQLGDDIRELGPGGTAFAPRGSAHGFLNPGDDEARYAAFVSPSGYEEYFREVQAYVTANGTAPDIEATRRLMARHATRLA